MEINESNSEVSLSRSFNAPREQIFRLYTDPALVPQWWGPAELTTVVEDLDVQPGGQWRFVQREADGQEHSFHGVFYEVVPMERLVYTLEYDGAPPGHGMREYVTFEERDGKTTVTVMDRFQSAEDMNEMLNSGLEAGAVASFDRMEKMLGSRR